MAGRTFRGQDVAEVLARLITERDRPAVISCDNGTEFTSKALDQWAYHAQVRLDFSRPGKPTDNAICEAFNGTFRRECLSQHLFGRLLEAQAVLDAWPEDYNNQRPHSSLGQQPPVQYRAGGYFVADRSRLQILRA
jgi:putative transposase